MRSLYEANDTGAWPNDWGETGVPGYGLYDRALGITYMQGLWEGLAKARVNLFTFSYGWRILICDKNNFLRL